MSWMPPSTLMRYKEKRIPNIGLICVSLFKEHVKIEQELDNPHRVIVHYVPLTPDARNWFEATGSIPDGYGWGPGDCATEITEP